MKEALESTHKTILSASLKVNEMLCRSSFSVGEANDAIELLEFSTNKLRELIASARRRK